MVDDLSNSDQPDVVGVSETQTLDGTRFELRGYSRIAWIDATPAKASLSNKNSAGRPSGGMIIWAKQEKGHPVTVLRHKKAPDNCLVVRVATPSAERDIAVIFYYRRAAKEEAAAFFSKIQCLVEALQGEGLNTILAGDANARRGADTGDPIFNTA